MISFTITWTSFMAVNHEVSVLMAISNRDSWSSDTDHLRFHFTRVTHWFRRSGSGNDWKQFDWTVTPECTDVVVT